MNRLFFLIMAFAVWAGLFAETVVKNSAPFSFPTTVGTMVDRQLLAGDASFRGKAVCTGKSAIVFWWSLPSAAENGVISIFRVDGSRIASLAIASSRGSVHWGIAGKTQAANGIYLATLSYGTIKRDCKVILYK
jgi:hypothetical protein